MIGSFSSPTLLRKNEIPEFPEETGHFYTSTNNVRGKVTFRHEPCRRKSRSVFPVPVFWVFFFFFLSPFPPCPFPTGDSPQSGFLTPPRGMQIWLKNDLTLFRKSGPQAPPVQRLICTPHTAHSQETPIHDPSGRQPATLGQGRHWIFIYLFIFKQSANRKQQVEQGGKERGTRVSPMREMNF